MMTQFSKRKGVSCWREFETGALQRLKDIQTPRDLYQTVTNFHVKVFKLP